MFDNFSKSKSNSNVYEYVVAEEIAKRLLVNLEKDLDFNATQKKIDDIIVDVANFFNIKKIDALRFFQRTTGKDPFIWYEQKLKEKRTSMITEKKSKVLNISETVTSSGNVASVIGGFNPDEFWRSIYPMKKTKPKELLMRRESRHVK